MKKTLFNITCFLLANICTAQRKTENLFIVTLEAMRWQEVFKGVDSAIIVDKNSKSIRIGNDIREAFRL